jgi:hypothetical protein
MLGAGDRSMRNKMIDVFISHASEDKASFVEPLAKKLRSLGVEVWYDKFSLTLGDSLNESITKGLSQCKYGIVVLSPSFFTKQWPQRELNGLSAREVKENKVILPIWHNVSESEVRRFSPILADKVGISTSVGVDCIAEQILQVLGKKTESIPFHSVTYHIAGIEVPSGVLLMLAGDRFKLRLDSDQLLRKFVVGLSLSVTKFNSYESNTDGYAIHKHWIQKMNFPDENLLVSDWIIFGMITRDDDEFSPYKITEEGRRYLALNFLNLKRELENLKERLKYEIPDA